MTCVPFNEYIASLPYDDKTFKSILKKHKYVVCFCEIHFKLMGNLIHKVQKLASSKVVFIFI